MSRPCKVCTHKDRKSIDRQIVSGVPMPQLSRQYGMSEDSLRNHRDKHISRQMQTASEQIAKRQGIDLFARTEKLMLTLEELVDQAKEKGKHDRLLQGVRELRSTYELIAKFQWAVQQQEQAEEGFIEERDRSPLNDTIHHNVQFLTKEEKEVYFGVLIKLINGSTNRVPYISYLDGECVIPPNFNATERIKQQYDYPPEMDHQDEPLQSAGRMTRTRPPARNAMRQVKSVQA